MLHIAHVLSKLCQGKRNVIALFGMIMAMMITVTLNNEAKKREWSDVLYVSRAMQNVHTAFVIRYPVEFAFFIQGHFSSIRAISSVLLILS